MNNNYSLNVFKSTLLTFVTKIFVFVLNAIIAISKARFLGPSGKGILMIIMGYIGILVLVGNLGIGLSSVYFLGQKKYSLDEIVTNSVIYAVFLSIGLIVVGYFGFELLKSNFLNGVSHNYLVLSLCMLPSYLFNLYLTRILLGLHKIKLFNLLIALEAFLTAILLIGLLIIDANVLNAIKAYVISYVSITIVGILFVIKANGRFIKFKTNLMLFKESFNYGVKAQVANLMQFLNYRLDIFLVNYFINPAAVGLYSVAVSIAESLWHVGNSLSIVLFPVASSASDESSIGKLTAKASRLGFLLTMFLILIIIPFASFGIRIFFGELFLRSTEPFLLLLPGIAFIR